MTERTLKWLNFGGTDRPAAAQPDAAETTGGGGGDGLGPVCIGSVDGPLRAEIARTYLEQAGLTVHLRAETASSLYGVVSGPLGVVQVWVPAAQAEEAARIFGELDFGDA